MKTTQRYLEILGVRPGVTRDELKSAYRAMIQIAHPDRFEGNEALRKKAEEQTRLVNEAYAYLMEHFETTSPAAVAAAAAADEPIRVVRREDGNGPPGAAEAKKAQDAEYRRRKARREAEEARRAAAEAEHERKLRQTVILGVLFLALLVAYAAYVHNTRPIDIPPAFPGEAVDADE